MKNEVNRAFTAKKRIYNQPEVQVTELASMPLMQAGSPANTMGFFGETGDQW